MKGKAAGRTLAALAGAALAAYLLAACSVRRSEPVVGPMPVDTPQLQRGEILYMRHCNMCHTGGEFGFGPALSNKPAPKFLMRTQVRAGLGAMPRFSRQEISPEELDDILAYVVAVRKHGR